MPVCDCEEACGCYAQGYSDGKDKAFSELGNVQHAGHSPDCGCRPCAVVRQVIETLRRRSPIWG